MTHRAGCAPHGVVGKLQRIRIGRHEMITTRRCFILLLTSLSHFVRAEPQLGGKEWTRRFRDFMKELNEFIIELNDNKLDTAKWDRVCRAWSAIGQP